MEKDGPYTLKCTLSQTIDVKELLAKPMVDEDYVEVYGRIGEGINLKPRAKHDDGFDVEWDSSHDRGIKASPAAKPTRLDLSVPKLKFQAGKIQVFSLLQRTPMEHSYLKDGNPLVYLLKGSPKYVFKPEEDRKLIDQCINGILGNFVDSYFSAIAGKAVIVACPSGNALNKKFAARLEEAAKRRGHTLELLDGFITKLSVNAMKNVLFGSEDPSFSAWLARLPAKTANVKMAALENDFRRMEKEHDVTFAFHFVRDMDTRKHITRTMALADSGFADVNGSNVLLIDDTMTTGKTVREACETLCQGYTPKTITALTLFSPLKIP